MYKEISCFLLHLKEIVADQLKTSARLLTVLKQTNQQHIVCVGT